MFYEFRQNNSGGRFSIDEDTGITVSVIIEARSASQANSLAEGLGIYFDGVGNPLDDEPYGEYDGVDCPCCGDRWYSCSDRDGTPVPMHYGTPVEDFDWEKSFGGGWAAPSPEIFVHYLDGDLVGYGPGMPKGKHYRT